MYYAMRASAPSLHRESTDSLIILLPLIYRHRNVKFIKTIDSNRKTRLYLSRFGESNLNGPGN